MTRRSDIEFHREMARLHVEEIRTKTVCSSCGESKAIDFHHKDHPRYPSHRISQLIWEGVSLDRIDREIEKCTALCRRCHLVLDGRLENLKKVNPHYKIHVGPQRYCRFCEKPCKILWEGLCRSCFEHERHGWPSTKIVCKWGHLKIGDNAFINAQGYRACKQCQREGERRYYSRTKENEK